MASHVNHKFIETILKGDLDFDTVTMKVMLLTSSYTPDPDHDFVDDVVANEVSGTGYVARGKTCTATVTRDTANNRVDLTLGAPADWTTSTITARYGQYYIERAGADSTDDLVALIDFGGNIVSTAGTFSLTASTVRFAV